MHHELWLDESHHWLLARDSTSCLDLIQNTRYEGHPILWNILLFFITRVTSDPLWMQILHILFSSAVVFIFLKKTPFSWVFKTLFIFGYFMLFEYNLISRNYILGILFLFLAASCFKNRKNNVALIGIYLALASNIHLMFCVIAFALFLTLLLEQYQNKQIGTSATIGIGVFLLGLILAAVQIIPPNDTLFFNKIDAIPFHEKLIKGFISLFKGLVTLPDFRSIHFWNSNIFVNLSKPFATVLGLLCYFIPLLFFKSRKMLFFVYTALLGTQIFFFVTQRGATRFDGMTFIILILALWLEHYFTDENKKLAGFIAVFKLNLLKKPIIYSILTIQLFSGVCAYAVDFKEPFCSAKETVKYIENENINTENIISITCDGTLISPFLEKKVYFLCDESFQSYCHWDSTCKADLQPEEIIEMISKYMRHHQNATYISTYPIASNFQKDIWINVTDEISICFLKNFERSIVRNADYFVYEVKRIKS